mmetsp:Transcript_3882/g.8322  ORF Transcript_3882/g.8322 Transcript_3882/m.8322 type:complete len:80 (+) Transcript_3882:650-889(+)
MLRQIPRTTREKLQNTKTDNATMDHGLPVANEMSGRYEMGNTTHWLSTRFLWNLFPKYDPSNSTTWKQAAHTVILYISI